MRNKYDDDGLLDDVQEERPAVAEPSASEQQEAPLPMPTPQDKSAEELSLERSLAVLQEIDRISEELHQKQTALKEDLKDIRYLQSVQEEVMRNMEKMVKKQHDVVADMERYNKDVINNFNHYYTFSEEGKQIIMDVLNRIVLKLISDTKKSLSEDLKVFAKEIVNNTEGSLNALKKAYRASVDEIDADSSKVAEKILSWVDFILIPKPYFGILMTMVTVLFIAGGVGFIGYTTDTESNSYIAVAVAAMFCVATVIYSWYFEKSPEKEKSTIPKPVRLSFSQALYGIGITVMSTVWLFIYLTKFYTQPYAEILGYLYATVIGSNLISKLLQILFKRA